MMAIETDLREASDHASDVLSAIYDLLNATSNCEVPIALRKIKSSTDLLQIALRKTNGRFPAVAASPAVVVPKAFSHCVALGVAPSVHDLVVDVGLGTSGVMFDLMQAVHPESIQPNTPYYFHEICCDADIIANINHVAKSCAEYFPSLDAVNWLNAALSQELTRAIQKASENTDEWQASWANALLHLTDTQIALAEALQQCGGLTYQEISMKVEDAFKKGTAPIPSNARTVVFGIRKAWEKNGVNWEIPTPKRGGKLVVRRTNHGKNATTT